eukprot:gb/GECG01014555.1/.p1 GENE.gb/GECG01014555.1/~~gb/GECG01014555.1/.p1  ORF type:complete len:472 (+),score=50.57 gb/GECG01014555.1/:1-1416(+)
MVSKGLCTVVFPALVALSVLLSSAHAAASGTSEIVNERVSRTFFTAKHVVRGTYTIRARNDGKETVSEYLFALPQDWADKLAFIMALDHENQQQHYEIRQDGKHQRKGFVHYAIELPDAGLSSGEETVIRVQTVFTNLLQPFPEVIEQDESQFAVLHADAKYASPYKSEKQSTTFKLGTKNIESYTEEEHAKEDGESLKYGPFESVSPYSSLPVRIHFETNHPFVTFREVEREIEISQWGNVAVEEHYSLKHDGAELRDGLFSRVDYQLRGHTANVLTQLTATLPFGSKDIYYRDIIGNVTTSNVRTDRHGTVMEISPRFPVFGGYKTEWYQGYNLDSEVAMTYDQSTNTYEVTFPFNIPYSEGYVQDYTVKVVLPEGATNVEVDSPHSVKRDSSRRFTYLDALEGRPIVVLRTSNIVKQHSGKVRVKYSMPSLYMLREPLMLIIAFFCLFVTYSVLSRIDLSLEPKSSSA